MRCHACNAPRTGDSCFKCGGPLEVPHPSWVEPELPPVERIRELANEVGYAIAVHGSLERDLDLIAVPWIESAVSSNDLIVHIATGLCANVAGAVEQKPLGRVAVSLQMRGWYKPIDLSISPIVK